MKEIENEYVKFWFEDGILMNKLKKPIHVNLEIMKELVELRHQISDNKCQYWLMYGVNLQSINKESRDYADVHGQDFIYATAALVNSHIAKFMFNTFVKLKTTNFPFKAFTSKEKAVAWLKELKEKNENH